MKTNILDLIDFEKVNTLLEGFNKSTGFVTAILDLKGNVLSKSGWRQICTEFHRVHPETSKKCTVSDTELAGKLAEGEKYHFYKCLNGLVDVAVPIVIKGEHIANLFSGQLFFEEPDRQFFKKQAVKYRFNEKIYIKALDNVPVVSQEKVKTAMDFLLNMTHLISEMTLQKMEQMELNEAIRKSEERWQFAIEGNGDGLWDWNLQTNEVFFSKQWKAMLGYDDIEIKDNFDEWGKRVHPEDLASAIEAIESYLNNDTDFFSIEHRLQCKNESYKWIVSRGKIIARTKEGKPLRFIGTHTDITGRKQAEEALKLSEEKFSKAFHNSPDIIMLTSIPDGRVIEVNNTMEKLSGFSHDEIIGKATSELQIWANPEDRERYFEILKRNNQVRDMEVGFRIKSGEIKNVIISGEIIQLQDGEYILAVIHDITERKKVDEALHKSEQEFRSLAESMPQIVWATRADGWNIYFNQQWIDYTGLTLEESSGHGWNKPFHPDDQQSAWDAWQNAVNNSGIYSLEVRLRRYDGEYRWWLVRGVPLINEEGEILKWFGTFTDIEDIKKAEEQNQKQLSELKRYNATMVDREIKMIQLKQEINDYCRQLNLPEKYSIPT